MAPGSRLLACVTAVGALSWTAISAAPAMAGTVPQIWPLGDSITYGLSGAATVAGMTAEGTTPGGYRATLDSQLIRDGAAHHFVGTSTANATPVLTQEGQNRHDGHPGYRIDQVAADLDGVAGGGTDDGGHWMTTNPDPVVPDVVVVLIGGNDILQHYDPATVFPTATGQADYTDPTQVTRFVADLTGRLQALMDKIETLHPGTEIVLSDTTPIGTGKVDAVTGPYAAAVQGLAAREKSGGMAVAYVDVWSQFVESTPNGEVVVPGMLGPDGIHPTSAGYQVLGQTFATAVESFPAG